MLTGLLCWMFSLVLPTSFCGEVTPTDAQLLRASSQAADLEFPAQPSALTLVEIPRMAVFKPDGNGPFPGLVLMHSCGGLGVERRPNRSILRWVREA
ncbi:MAG TPA: hypothetical protein VEI95_12080, partial [Acidobacteriota bacterium]|nr:hypothetical protein [Acidobacteriota bacterium]